jgi:hypothetical protein
MTPQDFIAKWKRANLSERSAAQQHFLDLCELLNQPKPATADPDGAFYSSAALSRLVPPRGWAFAESERLPEASGYRRRRPPWARYVHSPDHRGIGTVRYPRLVAKDDDRAKLLAKRTLTNLYNERPTWLDLAHKKLDAAVFAAYGWEAGMTDEEILERLLALNLENATKGETRGQTNSPPRRICVGRQRISAGHRLSRRFLPEPAV